MRLLVFLSLVLTVLAGCSDGGDAPADGPTSAECLEQGLILNTTGQPRCVEPPFVVRDFEDPDHFCVVNERRDRVHAPDLVGDPWELGQFWTYDLSIDGEALEPTQLIYYDDQDFDSNDVAAHYMVGTPTRDEALRHAVFSENPMIGRIHRILYSPHESGDHANMFNFPLCEGSSWSTRFFAEDFTLTAREATIPVPGLGQDAGFRIEGTAPSGSTLALTYSPAAQWFTEVDLQRADGGSVQMRLSETGSGYSGDAFFLRGQQDASIVLGGTTLPVGSVLLSEGGFEREDGRDGPYDVLGVAVEAVLNGTGQATVDLTAPDGTTVWSHELAGGDAVDLLFEVPYQAGTWTATLQGAGLGPDGGGFASFQVVSIYDRSGSV